LLKKKEKEMNVPFYIQSMGECKIENESESPLFALTSVIMCEK